MSLILMSIISEYIIIDDHVESELEKLIWATTKLKIDRRKKEGSIL